MNTDSEEYKNGFEDGKTYQKVEMLKIAVDGVITDAGGTFGYNVAVFKYDDSHVYKILINPKESDKHGDKVKLIIIRDETD